MTKAELIEKIARSRELPPDVTKKEIAAIVGIAFEELATYFARTKVTRTSSPRFTFPHFGTFTKKRRRARRGVNPRTLEPMEIEAFDTVDFKASKEFRDAMNRGASTPAKSGRRKAATAMRRGSGEDKSPALARRAKTKTPTKTKPKPKPKTKTKLKRAARGATGSVRAVAGGRRPLTPRDEAAELDAMIGDDELFAGKAKARGAAKGARTELPAARLQRVDSAEEHPTPRSRRRVRPLP